MLPGKCPSRMSAVSRIPACPSEGRRGVGTAGELVGRGEEKLMNNYAMADELMAIFGLKRVHSPGSDDAIASGCICPTMDNAHGVGLPYPNGRRFVIRKDCPLHGSEPVRVTD